MYLLIFLNLNMILLHLKGKKMKNEITRITFDIPTEKHKELKALAVLSGKSMRSIILEAIECAISSHIPNEETIKAIQDAKERKNLVSKKEADELNKKVIYLNSFKSDLFK